MKAILTGGALAAVLVLGACGQPADQTEDTTAADEAAMSAEDTGAPASAAAPADMPPAPDAATAPDAGSSTSAVNPETRAQAQEKAESTNLHPAG